MQKNYKTKDAKGAKEYDITALTKGFITTTVVDGKTIEEYFQFREINQIIYHPDIGVEIVAYNTKRTVFYNDVGGESLVIFNLLNDTMRTWMNSNLN